MVGTTISHYRILEKLGAGGMGEVYRAEDTKLGRQVALKTLPAGMAADPERLARLQSEARTLAALDHPNIVPVFSIDETDGVHFLTMGLVEGCTLQECMPARGLGAQQFFDFAIPLADALAAAHEKGVVHRDLKPGNVMVSEDGRLKVLDFGLAKRPEAQAGGLPDETTLSSLTRQGVILGTVPYMSPEQIEAKPVDSRSDVFSLGVLLYEMATGQRPFAGGTSPALMSSILKDSPPPVTELRPELPGRLGNVVGRCLEKHPAERFSTARAVHEALVAIHSEWDGSKRAPVMDPHETPTRVLSAPHVSGFRRFAPGVVALFVVALLVMVALLYAPWRRESAAEIDHLRKLAVLPFDDFSSADDQDWFASGMHEALLTALQQIDGIQVTSRRSVMRYRDTETLLPQIARELGVKWLVEGSVARVADQARITATLIDGSADRPVWSQQYERDVRDVLALQSELARTVAAEIHVTLTPEDKQRLTRVAPVHPETYRHYVLGLQYSDRVTREHFRAAVEQFELAIASDAGFAPAHAALAVAHGIAVEYSWISRAEAAPTAGHAAETALRLDPLSGDAHHALASVRFHIDRDFEAAERSYLDALDRISSSQIYFGYGWLLSQMGRHDDAVAALERAVELDPRSPLMHGDLGWWLYGARRFDRAIDEAQIAIALDADQPESYWLLAAVYSQKGEFEAALSEFARYEHLYGESVPWFRGYLLGLAGHRDEALQALEELKERVESGRSSPIELAQIYLGLGDDEQTLAVLEQADESSVSFQPFLWPEYERLFGDPRLHAVLEKFRLPPPPTRAH
jgi:serine/threonine protein kinase/tetratricopeptide (TPR) repeat protein